MKSSAFLTNWIERDNRVFGEVQETHISLISLIPGLKTTQNTKALAIFWKPFPFPGYTALFFDKLQCENIDLANQNGLSFHTHSLLPFLQQRLCRRMGKLLRTSAFLSRSSKTFSSLFDRRWFPPQERDVQAGPQRSARRARPGWQHTSTVPQAAHPALTRCFYCMIADEMHYGHTITKCVSWPVLSHNM